MRDREDEKVAELVETATAIARKKGGVELKTTGSDGVVKRVEPAGDGKELARENDRRGDLDSRGRRGKTREDERGRTKDRERGRQGGRTKDER